MTTVTNIPRHKPAYSFVGLIVWLGLTYLIAWFGSTFKPGDWYLHLAKPAWTPPGFIFGIVWPILYTLMGVAAWLVWKRRRFVEASLPLSLYLIQLVLNGMWSWIFFGTHNPGLAFAEILLLWIAILATTISFWRKSVPAGILMTPYLAWVTFASVLNFAIWRMNPGT